MKHLVRYHLLLKIIRFISLYIILKCHCTNRYEQYCNFSLNAALFTIYQRQMTSTTSYLSKLDAVYRSYLLTRYFVNGWGDPVNIQK